MNCKGNCCDPVVMSLSPQELTEGYITSKHKEINIAKEDIEKMYRLFVFKGESRVSPMKAGVYENGGTQFMYECKNFDYETRQCKDYKNRPKMCKNFGCNECPYENCK